MLCLKPWNAVSLQLCLFTIGAESVPCSSWDGHSGTEWILMLISCYEDFWCSAGGCVCFDCPECSVGEFHFSVLFWVIPGCPEYTRFSSDSSHEVLRLHGGADMPCSLWVTCLSFLLSTDPELLLGVIKKKGPKHPTFVLLGPWCTDRQLMIWAITSYICLAPGGLIYPYIFPTPIVILWALCYEQCRFPCIYLQLILLILHMNGTVISATWFHLSFRVSKHLLWL